MQKIEAVRTDIELLRELIDRALDKGVGAENRCLRAYADLLHRRRTRLNELEAITLYRSKGPTPPSRLPSPRGLDTKPS